MQEQDDGTECLCGEADANMLHGSRNVESRLRELCLLEDGWGENGDEVAPDRQSIEKLIDLMNRRYHGIPPYIFPMEDGKLEFEWDSKRLLVMDIDLTRMTGVLYDEDEEVNVDLHDKNDWDLIIVRVNRNCSCPVL